MDNITHTLIGVLVGETAAAATPASTGRVPAATRRSLFVALMAVGSNLPDLDFLHSTITGNKLDYLLHHRGYTHTVLGGIAIAVLMLLAAELWLRARGH